MSDLWQQLADTDLKLRVQAYQALKAAGASSAEFDRGIPLQLGDRIYGVFQASIFYGDDFYYIRSSVKDGFAYSELDYDEETKQMYTRDGTNFYGTQEDATGAKFDVISDFPEDIDQRVHPEYYWCSPRIVAYFLDPIAAQALAERMFLEKFEQFGCEFFDLEPLESDPAFDLEAWVQRNGITIDEILVNPEDCFSNYWSEPPYQYKLQVMLNLQRQKRFELLREIWTRLGYKPLAIVHEIVVDRPAYLRLSALESC